MRITLIAAAAALSLAGAASVEAQRIDAAPAGPMWDAAMSPSGKYLATGCENVDGPAICIYDLEAFAATAVVPAPDEASLTSMFWASDLYLIYTFETVQEVGTTLGVREYEFRRPVAFNAETRESNLLLPAQRELVSEIEITSLLRGAPDAIAIEMTIGRENERETGSRISTEPERRSMLQRVDLASGNEGRILERSAAATSQIAADPSGEVYALVRNRDNGSYEIIAVEDGDRRTLLEGRRQGDDGQAVVYGRIPGAAALGVSLPDQGPRRLDLETGAVSAFEQVGEPIVDSFRAELVGFDFVDELPRQVFLDDELAATQAALTNALGAQSVTLQAWSDDRQMMLIAAHGDDGPAFYLFDAGAGQLSAFEP